MKFSYITKFNLAVAAAAGLFSLTACQDDFDGTKYWENDKNFEAPAIKPRYIWVDAASNFVDFADHQDRIVRDLKLAKDAGFTDVVVDVRSTSGNILFKSDLAPQIEAVHTWVYCDDNGERYIKNGKPSSELRTVYRHANFDYLQTFIDEGHKLGLRIHAGFNTMTGGHFSSGPEGTSTGVLFTDPDKRDWATWHYNGGEPKSVMDLGLTGERFFNPGHPEVQEYICNLLKDLAKYNVDGIVLDRGRYNDLRADFSPTTRAQFEEYVGVKFSKWPKDILPDGTDNATLAKPYAKYTTKWIEFRAKTIHDFMAKAREAVKSVNPDIMFGVYVGGWYNSYYNTGANWASKKYDASLKHDWASTRFKNFGYADLMDQILIGAYAKPNGVYGSQEWSMQGFCNQAKLKIGGDCPLVVGGPDVDWTWLFDDPENPDETHYKKSEILDAIKNSVSACASACDGYFLFDMIHLKLDPEKWDAVSEGCHGYIADWEDKYGNKD